MKKKYVMIAVAVMAVGALAFVGGMKFQQLRTMRRFVMAGNRGGTVTFERGGAGVAFGNGQGGPAGPTGQNRMMVRPISGEIIAQDDTSITVKLPDGSSKIILIGENTTLGKTAAITTQDLAVGNTVSVFGLPNNDGSLSAQSVLVNPLNPTTPTATQSGK